MSELLSFTCPRCDAAVDEAFYGPCTSCRAQLVAANAGAARDDVEVAAYEPKMNVVPNQIASKD